MVRQKIDGQKVTMVYPKEILKQIDEYAGKNSITTRTTAIIELIRKGLKVKG